MTRRVYFVAHGGMVQGVGFRYFARKQANAHGITGWVEGEAQGNEDVLQTFLKDVDTGPPGSKVVKLDTEDRDVSEGETGFEVRH
ncbi:hypothetical protein INS49_008649 [Diaporthe citri]|uniref:uncharacterized protein n=1 Tax=Diaporthe citri TaxID=83186 RepID=UPI001C8073EA|nr:uncharacterized protein INS49_008649 [Diaporthe citri]KAG6363548.1 hypothetical protein INS49_008649 [Diaporthe citri]